MAITNLCQEIDLGIEPRYVVETTEPCDWEAGEIQQPVPLNGEYPAYWNAIPFIFIAVCVIFCVWLVRWSERQPKREPETLMQWYSRKFGQVKRDAA